MLYKEKDQELLAKTTNSKVTHEARQWGHILYLLMLVSV